MCIWKSAREYGHLIPNLTIDGQPAPYGVYNERAVRAGAGIMFVIVFFTITYTFYTRDFTVFSFVAPFLWIDFFIKVFWGNQYSPIGILAALLVKGQRPEYVGAIQKRFAWGIGLAMATLIMTIVFGFGVRQLVPLVICGICLLFMWMETALGICVGCKIYAFLLDKKILPEPDIRPVCPGGVCAVSKKRGS